MRQKNLFCGNGANSASTIDFVKYLREKFCGQRMVLIWDGAAHHKAREIKAYLTLVNQGKEEKEWELTCMLFAPNCPQQNPVEDVWLHGKNVLRSFWYRLRSFSIVKWLFKFALSHQKFTFPKIDQYAPRSILI
jgi:transposase